MRYHGLGLNDEIGKIMKVRIPNSDTHMGKVNGYRMLYYAVNQDLKAYLLTIYYKKEDNRIPSDEDIKNLAEIYLK